MRKKLLFVKDDREDRNYYTRAKYGVVFFVSLAVLVAIVVYILIESRNVNIQEYTFETEHITVGQTYSGSDEISRLYEEIQQYEKGMTVDDSFVQRYPSMYALMNMDSAVYNKDAAYTEAGSKYIGMAQAFKRSFSRYVTIDIMIMEYSCTSLMQTEGDLAPTAQVHLSEPQWLSLRYEIKTGELTYTKIGGSDSRVGVSTFRIIFEGDEDIAYNKVSYNINTRKTVSDTDMQENKFQQFVTIYSGDLNYVLRQQPQNTDDKNVGGYADFGINSNVVGVRVSLTDDLYEQFEGVSAACNYSGAGELRYSVRIN
ncbi:MAG TPA: hypothetical protein H9675_07995 [Firmicutes bacterium]|nr:hypothetical protein [Bacillota bacterium]